MEKFTLFLISFVFTTISFSQNLINNPGAESDPVANGWVIVTQGSNCSGSLNWRIQGNQSEYPAAQQGNYYFFSGCDNVDGEIYQDVNVSSYAESIDAATLSFTFSGYMMVFDQTPSDSSLMIVEYRNSASTVLDTYSTGYKGDRGTWVQYANTKTAPAGTRTIRITLLSKYINGSSVDAYFDSLSLTTNTILPVRLLSFTTSLQPDNTVKIKWQTASEINNGKFTIERSANGVDWFTVTEVASKGSNSGTQQNYSIVDPTPFQHVSYYRLKQTDINGQITYSDNATVKIKSVRQISIFPNPAKEMITISGISGVGIDLQIFNLSGQNMTKLTSIESSGLGKITVDVNKLSKGQYIIKTKTTVLKFSKL